MCSHLVYVQGDVVSDLQRAVNRPHVENVTSSDLRVLHCELHPLQRKKDGAVTRVFVNLFRKLTRCVFVFGAL